jgi:hypothetical protein
VDVACAILGSGLTLVYVDSFGFALVLTAHGANTSIMDRVNCGGALKDRAATRLRHLTFAAALRRLADVPDLTGSRRSDGAKQVGDDGHQILHAIRRHVDNDHTERETGDVLLVLDVPIHREEDVADIAGTSQERAVLGSFTDACRGARRCTRH